MRILTAAQIHEADRRAIEEVGIASVVLMENAGRQVVSAMYATIDGLSERRVGVLCGRGNNGGDGFVVARVLSEQGVDARVFLFGRRADVSADAGRNLAIADNLGVSIVEVVDSDDWEAAWSVVASCDALVDAIFGTGLNKPLDQFLSAVARDVNALDVPVVAIDLPSGLSADCGDPFGEAVEATVTVTLAAPKPALLMAPAESWAGDLIVADIGIPAVIIDELPGDRLELLTPDEIRRLMPARPRDAHKGDFGHVLIVAGSTGKTGAARLAGMGALRSGAGLVTVATPRSCLPFVASSTPEYMTLPLPDADGGVVGPGALEVILSVSCDVIVVGPGLGTGFDVSELVRGLISRSTVPLVLDADALTVLASRPGKLRGSSGVPIVITPHPGEMARLCQMTSVEVQADRLATARQFAVNHEIHVVLKGSGTVIANPAGAMWLNLTGNPGMATGGVGDVLAGVTGAWLAQLGNADAACQVAIFLHGLAGDLAADTVGEIALMASDVAAALGKAARDTADASAAEDGAPEP